MSKKSKRFIEDTFVDHYGGRKEVVEVITSPYSTPKKPSTVLERAHQLIDEGNWCRGELFNDKDKFCAVGAIDWCSGVDLQIYWEVEDEEADK